MTSGIGDYILGLVGLGAIVVAMAVGGRTLRRAFLPQWTGAPALLAAAVLAVALLVTLSELLGLFGLLDGVVLVVASLIVGGGALRLEPMLIQASARRPRARRPEPGPPNPDPGVVRPPIPLPGWPGPTPAPPIERPAPDPRSDFGQRDAPRTRRIELAIATLIAALVAVQWAGPTLLALDRGIYGGDSLWYHMPFAAHIAGTGSVTELLYTDPLYLNWFYPQVSELLHAGGLLLLGNDFLSPLLNLGWLVLALLAGWCVGRPYGAGAPAMAAVAALMSANLLFSRQPGNANNDVVAIALFLSSVAILVNARVATARGPLIVAGLAAGLAVGTKLTVVPPVGALTLGVIAVGVAGQRLRVALTWGAALAVGGGLWYARNLIVSGNPLPWVDIGPISHAEELQGRDPYSVAHYLTDTDVWGGYFTPGLEERLGDLWPLFLAAAVAGVVLWLWRGGRVERMLAAVAAASAIAYLITPLGASGEEGMPVGFRLNIRYLAPGLALALVLAAVPPPIRARAGWWRWGALAVFAVLIVVSAGAVEAIDNDRLRGSLLLAAVLVPLPVAIVLLARRGFSRYTLAGAAMVAVLGLAVLGRLAQEDYLDQRYSSAAPDYPRTEQPSIELGQGLGAAYDWARETGGESIALVGTTGALFQYGLWGGDASNEVTYLGDRGKRGSFREIPECPEWIGEINNGDFDYVVTAPPYDQDNPEAATLPVQRPWIAAARNAERVAGAALVDVWELTGPLDPIACTAPPPP